RGGVCAGDHADADGVHQRGGGAGDEPGVAARRGDRGAAEGESAGADRRGGPAADGGAEVRGPVGTGAGLHGRRDADGERGGVVDGGGCAGHRDRDVGGLQVQGRAGVRPAAARADGGGGGDPVHV